MTHSNVDGGQTLKPAPEQQLQAPRAKGARIAPETLAAAIAEYAAGASMTDVAHRHGISRNYLYERATGAGVRKRIVVPAYMTPEAALDALPVPQNMPARTYTPHLVRAAEVWAEIEADYLAGHSAPELADRYKVSVATIRDRAKTKGWRRKDRKVDPLRALPDPAQIDVDEDGNVSSAWPRIAHAAQRPPSGDWSTWLFQGGRGAGKTRAGAEWLAQRAEKTTRGRFALVGATLHDVREVMIDGPSGIRNLPGRETPLYEPSRRRLFWKSTQSEAFAFSADEPERLRGPQFEAAWADEFGAWRRGAYTLMLLRMGIRLGAAPQLVVTTTPKPTPAMRALRDEVSCVVTLAPTAANAAILAPSFLEGLEALYARTRWKAQELEGVLLDGAGALWRHEDLVAARGSAPERCERVIVAVDPPAGQDGAACGIVVAGRVGEMAYVLADRTQAGLSPLGWARAVAEAARDFGAHEIVAEANQGGDMVRTTLGYAEPPAPIRLVHARENKRVRAQPVAALYEQRRVVHAGVFTTLEEELMALGSDGDEGETRRDRADALVWAIRDLMVRPSAGPRIRVP